MATPQKPRTYEEIKPELMEKAGDYKAGVISHHNAVEAIEEKLTALIERINAEEDSTTIYLMNQFLAARRKAVEAVTDMDYLMSDLRPVANEAAIALGNEAENINKLPSKAFGDELGWLTVRKVKTFLVHDVPMLARWLLGNNREDLVDVGGSTAEKAALIKAGVLPKLDDGRPSMEMVIVPGATISASKIVKDLTDVTTAEDK